MSAPSSGSCPCLNFGGGGQATGIPVNLRTSPHLLPAPRKKDVVQVILSQQLEKPHVVGIRNDPNPLSGLLDILQVSR